MPTHSSWVEPAMFLAHNGVVVFHTYVDDDLSQGPKTYWFTTNSLSDDESFDVRDLDVPSRRLLSDHPPFLCAKANPAFATASDEQKAEWRRRWDEWQKDDGREARVIAAMVREAIDLELIKSPEYA